MTLTDSATVSAAESAVPSWRPSHRDLLTQVRPRRVDRLVAALPCWLKRLGVARGVDAIVVPTSRPATASRPGIDLAADLAVRTGATLVVICSRDAATESALTALRTRLARRSGLRGIVVVPESAPGPLTTFAVDGLSVSTFCRSGGNRRQEGWRKVLRNDVGRKRNIGLVMAQHLGWRTVLFLDDDVFPRNDRATLDPVSLAAASRAVSSGRHAAVGWTLVDFDDNSVLFRIRSVLGRKQEQFIGGGALLVKVDEKTPFFPGIYNEDWLFLLGFLRDRRSLGEAGDVHQEAYEAYTPNRARSEELGDILCEGLMTIFGHAEVDSNIAEKSEFWERAVEDRIRLRQDLACAVAMSDHPDGPQITEALDTLEVLHDAFQRALSLWSHELAAYWPTWSCDRAEWESRLTGSTRLMRLADLRAEVDHARSFLLGRRSHALTTLLGDSPRGGPGEYLLRFATVPRVVRRLGSVASPFRSALARSASETADCS